MHKYNGLAFWDYSAAAAHIKISMNPVVLDPKEEGMGKKDAMFFSGNYVFIYLIGLFKSCISIQYGIFLAVQ